MSEYRVIITETLKRAVTVEAESREEAEEAVRRQYQNSEHILVAEDFDGVSFSAQYPEQQVELPYGKMKELFRKAERAGTHVCGYITFMQDCFTVQYGSGASAQNHGASDYHRRYAQPRDGKLAQRQADAPVHRRISCGLSESVQRGFL